MVPSFPKLNLPSGNLLHSYWLHVPFPLDSPSCKMGGFSIAM